jgi:hypothetical protein
MLSIYADITAIATKKYDLHAYIIHAKSPLSSLSSTTYLKFDGGRSD